MKRTAELLFLQVTIPTVTTVDAECIPFGVATEDVTELRRREKENF